MSVSGKVEAAACMHTLATELVLAYSLQCQPCKIAESLHHGDEHTCMVQWPRMPASARRTILTTTMWHASLHACRPTAEGRPALQLTDLEVEELRKSFLSHCKLLGADAEAMAPLLVYCSYLTQNQPGPFVILLDKIAQVGLAVTCPYSGQHCC